MDKKNEDPNLINLKDWQKKKAQEARSKAGQAGAPKVDGLPKGMGPKIVLAVFFLVILWLAMPAGFIATLTHTITGR